MGQASGLRDAMLTAESSYPRLAIAPVAKRFGSDHRPAPGALS
jgi:hypothetical protein